MSKYYSKMRYVGRWLCLTLMGVNAKPSNGVHILNGHMIQKHLNAYDSGARQFRIILKYLSELCDLVKIEDAIEMIENRISANRPIIAFTFDDGYEDCYLYIAPILEEFGINALFFINPNFVDGDEDYIRHFTEEITLSSGKKPMRWEQIRELQNRGFLFGAHTMDHYMVNTNNIDELEYQIGNCKKSIEESISVPCHYFAFPYGRLEHANNKAIEIACKYYRCVFSQSDYKRYFSFGGRVINRRHFEPFWPVNHVAYFLSKKKVW